MGCIGEGCGGSVDTSHAVLLFLLSLLVVVVVVVVLLVVVLLSTVLIFRPRQGRVVVYGNPRVRIVHVTIAAATAGTGANLLLLFLLLPSSLLSFLLLLVVATVVMLHLLLLLPAIEHLLPHGVGRSREALQKHKSLHRLSFVPARPPSYHLSLKWRVGACS